MSDPRVKLRDVDALPRLRYRLNHRRSQKGWALAEMTTEVELPLTGQESFGKALIMTADFIDQVFDLGHQKAGAMNRKEQGS